MKKVYLANTFIVALIFGILNIKTSHSFVVGALLDRYGDEKKVGTNMMLYGGIGTVLTLLTWNRGVGGSVSPWQLGGALLLGEQDQCSGVTAEELAENESIVFYEIPSEQNDLEVGRVLEDSEAYRYLRVCDTLESSI
jgi:hypothetical protein